MTKNENQKPSNVDVGKETEDLLEHPHSTVLTVSVLLKAWLNDRSFAFLLVSKVSREDLGFFLGFWVCKVVLGLPPGLSMGF